MSWEKTATVDVIDRDRHRPARRRRRRLRRDSSNAPAWYQNITSVTCETSPPLHAGSKLTFSARFLGLEFAYTYEITDFVPAERLVMRTAQGPFPMETTYTWQPAGDHSTRMTLRNPANQPGSPGSRHP